MSSSPKGNFTAAGSVQPDERLPHLPHPTAAFRLAPGAHPPGKSAFHLAEYGCTSCIRAPRMLIYGSRHGKTSHR